MLYFILFYLYLYEAGIIFILILQIREPRLREVDWLVQNHTANVGEAGTQLQLSRFQVFGFS